MGLLVHCSLGIAIMWHGQRSHLNIADILGIEVAEVGQDYRRVDFSGQLPANYAYLEGPILLVKGNDCLYVFPPPQFDTACKKCAP